MNQEEKILEFDKIKLRWQEYAVTERAREKISETKPVLSRRELDVLLRETEQSRQLLEKCGTPPLAALSGMEENLGIASKGDCLSAFQLEQVKDALVAVRRMSDYLERGKAYSISLAYYAENLDVLEALSGRRSSRRSAAEKLWIGLPPDFWISGARRCGAGRKCARRRSRRCAARKNICLTISAPFVRAISVFR